MNDKITNKEKSVTTKYQGIRHGENLLLPVETVPKGKTTKHDMFIVGHSETGHHHVLEAKKKFEVTEADKELYLTLFEPAKLVHKKQLDKHKTLIVQPGKYLVKRKSEYDPWQGVIREVFD